MIEVSLGILNPWEYSVKERRLIDWNPSLIDHKMLRLMLGTLPKANDLFRFRFSSKFWGPSKTGLILNISILQFAFEFRFYDTRHFDFLNNEWKA